MTREFSKVLIVGGGPAGISTALFLAHAAPELTERIVVLEKERYPREKFCAGAVGARADRLLASIGVIVDVPSAPIGGIAFRALGKTISVREPDAGRVVRRIEFDHALARHAVQRGISVMDGVRVNAIRVGTHQVRVETSAGDFDGDIVVGADGVGSVVRRALGFTDTPYLAQALEVDTPSVDGDPSRDLIFFDVSNRALSGYYWDFPTIVDGEPLVCRGVYYLARGAAGPRAEIRDILAEELRTRGLDLEKFRKKRYAERGFHRAAALAARRALLVGEAAGIDPVTGEGIAQAVQYGAVAGAYLARKIAESEYAFADWASHVRSSMVGRDLMVREAAFGLFYGPRRPNVERFLLECPDFIRLGLQHFSGKPWSGAAVARGTFGALKATAGALLRSAVAPPGPS
jgi:flavin-dependent dehydrogenase